MSVGEITNTDPFKVAALGATVTAFVGWFRERRKARKDANNFALEFMTKQSERIDGLVKEVAEIKADRRVAYETLNKEREDGHELRGDIAKLRLQLQIIETENVRLRTELSHHPRAHPSNNPN